MSVELVNVEEPKEPEPTQEVPEVERSAPEPAPRQEPAPKKKGRPLGSKNKPKITFVDPAPPQAEPSEPKVVAPNTPAPESPKTRRRSAVRAEAQRRREHFDVRKQYFDSILERTLAPF